MSEQEGGFQPEKAERINTVPEKYDHKGIRFESPQADQQLSFLRDKVMSERRMPNVLDAVDLVRVEIQDIQEQKTFVMGGNESMRPGERNLKRVQSVILKAAAGQYDEISMLDKTAVNEYLTRHVQRWDLKAGDPRSEADVVDEAQENRKIFESLRETLFTTNGSNQTTDEVSENVEPVETPQEKQTDNPDLFPEYAYDPDNASDYLAELRAKEEVSLDDLDTFYDKAKEDIIQKMNTVAETEEDGQTKKALQAAVSFYRSRQKDFEKEKNDIVVSLEPSGSMHVGFESSSKNPPGTENFAFDLHNATQYESVLGDLDLAKVTLGNLKENNEEIKRDLASSDPQAFERAFNAVMAMVRPLRAHFAYIDDREEIDLTDEQAEDTHTLNKFFAVLTEKTGFSM